MTASSVRTVSANGLRFACLSAGAENDGPLALCLHGFPDTAYTWRHLMPALAEAGFRVAAPFMRGYAPTGIPEDNCYETAALASDALALHEELGGGGDAVIIGHGWGAFAAYGASALEPRRWSRLVALSSPPTRALIPSFLDYEQLRRSFYQFVFQTPLAEAAVAHDDFAFIKRLWHDWTADYDPRTDIAHVLESLADQANLSAAIGYYRGIFDVYPPASQYSRIRHRAAGVPHLPVLYLHGRLDGCLGAEPAENARAVFSADSEVEVLDEVGHFPHLERPAAVNRRILEWLA